MFTSINEYYIDIIILLPTPTVYVPLNTSSPAILGYEYIICSSLLGILYRGVGHKWTLIFGDNARLTMGKPGNGNVTNRVGNYNLHGWIIHSSTHQT